LDANKDGVLTQKEAQDGYRAFQKGRNRGGNNGGKKDSAKKEAAKEKVRNEKEAEEKINMIK
jgi:hypothetical protein